MLCGGVLLVLWSCGGRKMAPEIAEAPRDVSPDRSERVEEIERELALGESLVAEQRWDEARMAFDRAVDLMLSAPGGAGQNAEIAALYEQALARIHEHELRDRAEEAIVPEDEVVGVEELAEAVELTDIDPRDVVEAPSAAEDYDLPIDYNARVAAVVEMFQERRRDWFQEALRRSGRYVDSFRQIFRESGLPEDLVYLSMVESAFKERAVSRAGAGGIWQFIRGTGRRYGLEVDHWVDQRFDPEKSARAAAAYLKDLYDEFGDWYLAMAAYNAGENRVRRAIARTGSRDFWTISRTRHLARETRSYVPLILAAVVIAKDPVRYGFDAEVEERRRYDAVTIGSPVDLATAARCAGTTLEEMKRLNPELRRWVTPSNRSEYTLRVPEGGGGKFLAALDAIPPQDRVRFVTHTVRRGDTLSHIARRYATSAGAVAEANRIGLRTLIHPGQILTIPVPAGVAALQGARDGDGDEDVAVGGVYIVRRGDTLSEIATRQGVSLAALRRLNGLERRSLIHPGQRLRLSGESTPAASTGSDGVRYRVRRGDTLSKIARRFAVSVQQLRLWNDLSHDRILAGESLSIYPGSP